jgi:hypothetical protein
MYQRRPLIDRLLEKRRIDPVTQCWVFVGARLPKGYGIILKGGKRTRGYVHRLAYELLVGPIPEGLNVCHNCDNPPCFNPSHLFVGTTRDNSLDAKRKGRLRGNTITQRRGEANPAAKLQAEDVVQIRSALAAGYLQKDIATRFGVKQATVSCIRSGKLWRHVP